jgi:hypothetical protein
MKLRIGLVALICVLTSGCGIVQTQRAREAHVQRMNELVGQPVDELVKYVGPPNSTFELSQGGAVFEYVRSRQVTRGGGSMTTTAPALVGNTWVSVPQQHAFPVVSSTRDCRMLVVVTPARTVESWKQEGRGC